MEDVIEDTIPLLIETTQLRWSSSQFVSRYRVGFCPSEPRSAKAEEKLSLDIHIVRCRDVIEA